MNKKYIYISRNKTNSWYQKPTVLQDKYNINCKQYLFMLKRACCHTKDRERWVHLSPVITDSLRGPHRSALYKSIKRDSSLLHRFTLKSWLLKYFIPWSWWTNTLCQIHIHQQEVTHALSFYKLTNCCSFNWNFHQRVKTVNWGFMCSHFLVLL